MKQLKHIGVPLTKAELTAMRFPCPFCGQEMILIDDDDAGYTGSVHQREFVFEHARDHDAKRPHDESGCSAQVAYFFGEDSEDENKEHIEGE